MIHSESSKLQVDTVAVQDRKTKELSAKMSLSYRCLGSIDQIYSRNIEHLSSQNLSGRDFMNNNDAYKPYYLSPHKELHPTPSIDKSAQKRLPAKKKYRKHPKLPWYEILDQWLSPPWVYCIIHGFGSLIGFALAIVLFGFALYFIIVHSSSLF